MDHLQHISYALLLLRMSHTWQMSKNPNKCIAIVRISQFMQDRNALKGAFRSLKFRGTMKLRGDYQNQNKPCGSSRFLRKINIWKIKNLNNDLAKNLPGTSGIWPPSVQIYSFVNRRLLSGHFQGCSSDQTHDKIRDKIKWKLGEVKKELVNLISSVTLRGDEKMADVMAGNSSADANGNEVSDVNAVSAAAGMPTNYIVFVHNSIGL